MSATRTRFEYATELRRFADKVEALELASNGDPEAPIVAKMTLVQEMRARASEVMKKEETVERGTFRADVVFANFGKRNEPARPVIAERRGPRLGGTLALKAAA